MRKSVFLGTAISIFVSAQVAAMTPQQVSNPRRVGKWVADDANMLSSGEIAQMNSIIGAAEAETGMEVAVVTVPSVSTPTPKDFATELFNLWGIGKANTNNGLLILMVKDQRRLEMETGYGTETVLTDGWLKKMQERDMVPRFKEGNFGQGIIAGLEVSIERMRQYQLTGEISDPGEPLPMWPFGLLGGGGVIGGALGWRRRKWKAERQCPECQNLMEMLPEDEDDEHLTEGQQTEEMIGSVNWEYWYCAACQRNKLIGVGKLFSSYSRCNRCHNKTLSTQTNTLTAPTQYSTGTAEVISECAHCSYRSRTTRTLAMLPPPSTSSSSSSSSSSSGGSFGGGSSGGGGAGSSW